MRHSAKFNTNLFGLFCIILMIAMSSCSGSKSLVRVKNHKKRPSKKQTAMVVTKEKKNEELELSPFRSNIVNYASRFLYRPYRYGGQDPSGFDCSGFTSFIYSNYGLGIGRTSNEQCKKGDRVSVHEVKPGDLMFFGSDKKVSHVAIVYERKDHQLKIIHATSSKGVIISHYTDSEYWTDRFLYAKDVLSKTSTDFAFR